MSCDNGKNEIYLQPMEKIPLSEYLQESESVRRETFLVSVEDIVFADNIRPFDEAFVDELKESIKEQGQLQECIGDIITDEEGNLKVRIIAGQHRAKAIIKLNQEGYIIPIRISVANTTLDPEKVIAIQMSENLQNKMTPAQDAVIICNYWKKLKEAREAQGGTVSFPEIARKIGRSTEKVKEAVKYVDGLDVRVQKMVDDKQLYYTYALLLADLPKEGGFMTTQFEVADLFFREKFPYKKAVEHVKKLREEGAFVKALFENWEEIKIEEHLKFIHDKSTQKALEAGDWFNRNFYSISNFQGEKNKVGFSTAIVDGAHKWGWGFEEWKKELEPLVSEALYKKLFGKPSEK